MSISDLLSAVYWRNYSDVERLLPIVQSVNMRAMLPQSLHESYLREPVTPLFVAAVKGHTLVCELLVSSGAVVDRPCTMRGLTPFLVGECPCN